ncbi:calcium-binding protein [Alsobacter ponti]|uniref:calcium-binding protein n=1 Tax=Alsobacter ponti TaxID=2962936 RepID=UPI00273A630C|nr:hypothetical protein [Alsobacter ponti]
MRPVPLSSPRVVELAQASARPEVLHVGKPPPGAIKLVDVSPDHDLAFDFAMADVKIAIVDVDLVIVFPDGARLILPGLAMKLMDPNAPVLHFVDGDVAGQNVFAQISDIHLSESLTALKLTSETPDNAKGAGEAQEGQPPVDVQPPPRPIVKITEETPETPNKDQGDGPSVAAGQTPPPPIETKAIEISNIGAAPSAAKSNGISSEVVASVTFEVLGVVTSESETRDGVPYLHASPAKSPADTDPTYANMSAPTTLAGGDGDEWLGPSAMLTNPGEAVADIAMKFTYPAGYGWTATSITFVNVPAGVTIIGAARTASGTYVIVVDDATPNEIVARIKYTIPPDGVAADANGFLKTFALEMNVIVEDSTGATKSMPARLACGVREVGGETDTSFTDPATGAKTAVLWANPPGAHITGGGGDDTVVSTAGADTLDGGTGENLLSYELSNSGVSLDAVAGTVSGGAGRGDRFTRFRDFEGSNFADTLSGDEQDNVLIGGAGADRLDGRGGLDTASYAQSAAPVSVNLRTGVGAGGDAEGDVLSSIERVVGSAWADTLVADDRGDTLDGGAGGDLLISGAGADSLQGGTGVDTVSYAGSNAAVSVNLATGAASGGWAANDSLAGLENATGSAFADTIVGSDGDNQLVGLAGGDSLSGGAGADTLLGGDGDDTLVGGEGSDSLVGGAGNDAVDYAGSASGVSVDLGQNSASGGDAEGDTLSGIEIVYGTRFADTLAGSSGGSTLVGRGGDDSLLAGTGQGSIDGGADTDTLSYALVGAGIAVDLAAGKTTWVSNGAAKDDVAGVENVIGSRFGDRLAGDAAANVLTGGLGADTLAGGGGDDTLDGSADDGAADLADYSAEAESVVIDLNAGSASGAGAGRDLLIGIEDARGGAAGDRITGDDGDNRLSGMGGGDTFVSSHGVDSIDGGDGQDVIDYSAEDSAVRVSLADGFARVGGQRQILTDVENVVGTSYHDVISGDDASDNSLVGGQGDDTLGGSAGADTLDGGDGDDLVDFSASAAAVMVDLRNGLARLDGSAVSGSLVSVENATGSRFNDTLYAADPGSELTAGAGDDLLVSGAGSDTLSGGAGVDTADYSRAVAGVYVDLVNARASVAGEGVDTLESIEVVLATQMADTIIGGEADNLLRGLGGNDSLFGGMGRDTLLGGDGDDTLDGGAGGDSLVGDAGNDLYRVDDAGDQISDSAGADTVESTAGAFTLSAGLEDLLFTGTGDFTGVGNDSQNRIVGGAGADSLDGAGGADTLEGGAGDDNYRVDTTGDSIVEAADGGTDRVVTTLNEFDLSTQSNVEYLAFEGTGDFSGVGNDVANEIKGGTGNDTLAGLGGADTLIGGDGSDMADYSRSAQAVNVDLTRTEPQVGGDAEGDRLVGIEKLRGSSQADTLVGDAAANVLDGQAGDDSLVGGGGADTMSGGAGDDTYVVDDANDVTTELADGGNDTVRVVTAVSARATAQANIENLIYAGAGNFTGIGNALANRIEGGSGNDSLSGLGGANTLIGNDGDDTLAGVAGPGVSIASDSLVGGAGDDVYLVDSTSDVVAELPGGGTDEIQTANLTAYDLTANAANAANVENLTYTGSQNFTGTGNALANVITGGSGKDTLSGAAGDDTLVGGAGADSLDGGVGLDEASYANATTSVRVDLTSGLGSGGDAEGDTYANIENARGSITAASTLIGNSGDNVLIGGDANDRMTGGLGADTLIGGAGADYLDGGVGGTGVLRVNATNAATARIADTGVLNNKAFTLSFDLRPNGTTNLELSSATGTNNSFAVSLTGTTLTVATTRNPNVTWTVPATANVYDGNLHTVTITVSASRVVTTYVDGVALGTRTLSALLDMGGPVSLNVTSTGTSDVDSLYLYNRALGATEVSSLSATAMPVTSGLISAYDFDRNDLADAVTRDRAFNGGAGIFLGSRVDAGDSLVGGDGNNTLVGGSGADTIVGGSGNESIMGGAGADSIVGGGGRDTIDYGDGVDTIDYSATSGVTFNLTTGISSQAPGSLLYGVENVIGSLTGSNFLTGSSAANRLEGGAASDTLLGMGDADTLIGNGGNDSLVGDDTASGSADSLSGGDGNDTLIGGGGADTLSGGLGTDTASYATSTAGVTVNLNLSGAQASSGDASNDVLSGIENVIGASSASNNLTGDGAANVLTGGSAADTLSGNAGDDSLVGQAGNDSLNGGAGADTLDAGVGNDTLIAGDGNDSILGGAGSDSIDGGTGTDTLSYAASAAGVNVDLAAADAQAGGDAANDTIAMGTVEILVGSSVGANRLGGWSLAESLVGGAAADTIGGGLGADTLDGGSGNDILFAGKRFLTDSASTSTNIATGLQVANSAITIGFQIKADVTTGSHLVTLGGVGVGYGTGGITVQLPDGSTTTYTYTRDTAWHAIALRVDADGFKLFVDGIALARGAAALPNNGTTLAAGVQLGADPRDGNAYFDDILVYKQSLTDSEIAQLATRDTTTLGSSFVTKSPIFSSTFDTPGFNTDRDTSANSVSGGDGNDTLVGGIGADTLLGGNGSDSLLGDAGNDSLDGGADADTMDGGLGNDAYRVTAGDSVTESSASGGADTVYSEVNYTLGANLEDLVYVGTGAFTGVGNSLNNRITGGAGADSLVGADGSDTIFGLAGNDTIVGKAASWSDGNLSLDGGDGNDSLVGGYGNDTLAGGDGNDTLIHGWSNDPGSNSLDGGAGNDRIQATYSDTVQGGAGNDTLIAVAGASANQTMTFNMTASSIEFFDGTQRAGAESVTGGTGNETIRGGNGGDTLISGGGVDSIAGMDGNDLVKGVLVTGARFDGGDGADTLWLDNPSTATNLELYLTRANLGFAGGVTVSGFEGLDLSAFASTSTVKIEGTTGADTIVLGAGADTINGMGGADSINAGAGNDQVTYRDASGVVLDGGAGVDTLKLYSATTVNLGLTDQTLNDSANVRNFESIDATTVAAGVSLTGSTGSNSIVGSAFADTIDGGGGTDTIDAGAGNDRVIWSGAGTAVGGSGNDTLIVSGNATARIDLGPSGFESLDVTGSRTAAMTVTGGTAAESIRTGGDLDTGNDSVDGGGGADTVTTGGGNDTVVWREGASLDGGAGSDALVISGSADYTINFGNGSGLPSGVTSFENILTSGYTGRLTLLGSSGSEQLQGGSQADTILGNGGNDTIAGKGGADSLDGGQGIDTLDYSASAGGVVATLDATGRVVASGGDAQGDIAINFENLTGSATGADSLTGNSGANILSGGGGNDSLVGGAGADTLDGGAGIDTVDYSASIGGITISLPGGWALGGDAQGDVVINAENVIGSTTGANNIAGSAAANAFTGGAGADTLIGGGGADTLIGGGGNDLLIGGTSAMMGVSGSASTSSTISSPAAMSNTAFALSIAIRTDVGSTAPAFAELVGANWNTTARAFPSLGIRNNGGAAEIIYQGANVGGALTTWAPPAGMNPYDGERHSFTLSVDAAGVATAYMDGVALTLKSGSATVGLLAFSGSITARVGLSGSFGNVGTPDAEYDNFLVYNRALTSDEAKLLALDTVNGAPVPTGLVAAYCFDGSNPLAPIGGLGGTMAVTGSASYVSIDTAGNSLDGAAGNDTLLGGGFADTLLGGTGNDSIDGNGGADSIDGGDGNDALVWTGAGTVLGGAGSDTLTLAAPDAGITSFVIDIAAAGIESFDGSGRTEAQDITGGAGNETILTGGGGDTVRGAGGADSISTGAGNDSIDPGAGADTVLAGSGDDTVDAGDGAGSLDGSTGSDTLLFTGSASHVVNFQTGLSDATRVSGFEAIDASAATGPLTLIGSTTLSEVIRGGTGNDSIDGGNAGTVFGGAGNDRIVYRWGGSVDGGAGNDTLVLTQLRSAAENAFNLAAADQTPTTDGLAATNLEAIDASALATAVNLTGSSGANTLLGGSAGDTIAGGGGSDSLDGGAGDDSITGSTGADTIVGGAGDDTITGAGGSDQVSAGDGNDQVNTALGGTATLSGGAGNDTLALTGAGGTLDLSLAANPFTGFEAIDAGGLTSAVNFKGSTAAESVTGSASADTLDGGGGADSVDAGDGADRVIYRNVAATLDGGAASDTLVVSGAVSINLGQSDQTVGDNATVRNFENIDAATATAGVSVIGSAAANSIAGSAFADTINGAGGADTIDAGGGDDNVTWAGSGSVIGGAGQDTLSISSNASVSVNLSSTGFEALRVSGSRTASMTVVGGVNAESIITGLNTDTGADSVDGGGGADTISTGGGNDTVVWRDGASLDGGAGSDALVLTGSDALTLDFGTGTLFGGRAVNFEGLITNNYTGALNLIGTNASQILQGGSAADTIIGLGGDDTIAGKGGADSLDGGQGVDTLDYSASAGGVTVTLADAGQDTVSGGDADGDTAYDFENVIGSSTGADSLTGNSGANILSGGGGNDTLVGGAGADTLDGGAGIDTVDYSASAGGVMLSLVSGTGVGGDAQGDVVSNVENIIGSTTGSNVLTGTAGANSLTGGNAADTLTGGGGADTLLGFGGNDSLTGGSTANNSLDGGAGNDTLLGGAFFDAVRGDTLLGGAGNDSIDGNGGKDSVDGGDGNDVLLWTGDGTVLGGAGSDTLTLVGLDTGITLFQIDIGASGIESYNGSSRGEVQRVTGGTGNETITTGSGADRVNSGAGNDRITTGAGNDTINSGTGQDTVLAGDGDDSVVADGSAMWLDGGTGTNYLGFTGADDHNVNLVNNTIDAGTANQGFVDNFRRINAGVATGNFTVIGAAQTFAWFVGGAGNDSIDLGEAAYETIRGGAGNDRIVYWAGQDNGILDGEAGQDTLVLGSRDGNYVYDLAANDQSPSNDGDITVQGFEAIDASRLSATVYLRGTTNADTLIGSSAADGLIGRGGADSLDGRAGDDAITVLLGGNATAVGGSGNDTLVISGAGGAIDFTGALASGLMASAFERLDASGATSAVNFLGTTSADSVTGSQYADTIDGKGGGDSIAAGAGDDRVIYSNVTGAILAGEAGNDILVLGATTPGLVVNLGNAADQTLNDFSQVLTFESVDGSAATAALNLTGSTGANTLLGGSGNDTLSGGGGADSLSGGDGADSLLGGGAAETILGGAGNDTIAGIGAGDRVDAGDGDDRVTFAANAQLLGGAGNDTLVVGAAASVDLVANTGFERVDASALGAGAGATVVGSSSDETILGGSGSDSLDGGLGVDSLAGGAGDDRLVYHATSATLDGGTGNDTLVLADAQNVNLSQTADQTSGDNAVVTSFEHVDASGLLTGVTLTGSTSANVLTGGSGADTISGGAGADTILAGAGDRVDGGADNDLFRLDTSALVTPPSIEGGAGTDTVSFSGGAVALSNVSGAGVLSHVEVLDFTGAGVAASGSLSSAGIRGIAGADGASVLTLKVDGNDVGSGASGGGWLNLSGTETVTSSVDAGGATTYTVYDGTVHDDAHKLAQLIVMAA